MPASRGATIKKPLPMIDASGVTVAFHASAFLIRGLSIDIATIVTIDTSRMSSQLRFIGSGKRSNGVDCYSLVLTNLQQPAAHKLFH